MFDLYPRHSHRTPQQIAEDTGGTFEPTRPPRGDSQAGTTDGSSRGSAMPDHAVPDVDRRSDANR